MNLNIEIKIINSEHSKELSSLLSSAGNEYSKYFIPFDFDLETIKTILINAVRDKYYGVFINSELAGYYMLRGLDDGYSVPSYGVFIASEFAGGGLAKLTVQHAISVCRMNKIEELILKVHPENIYAKKIYEDFGFSLKGKDDKNGNLIYTIKISEKKK